MLYALRRHPIPIAAHFEHCLVLTYAFPADLLRPLLPPGLEVDCFQSDAADPGDLLGFVAVALVQTCGLRPVGLPSALGQDFFLSGYRIFTRFRTPDGRRLRGLRILRSDTNHRRMALGGNLLTHYNYHLADVTFQANEQRLEVRVQSHDGAADLDATAQLDSAVAPLPVGSCFATERIARRFSGPLPYTFDYERQTHSIIAIRGRRREWHPRLVGVDVRQITFFARPPFTQTKPRLVSAFYLSDVSYRWDRGIRYPLNTSP